MSSATVFFIIYFHCSQVKMKTSPLLTQFLVALSPQLAAFSVGGAVTFPSLLMEQFRANSTSIVLDMDTKSWIGSIYGLAGLPVILMPVITQKYGRKFGYIMSCFYIFIGWILTFTATSSTGILISESFHGLGVNSILPVSFLGMSEMLAPKYRFISMQVFAIVQGVGMSTCGILGRFFHFKTISIVMFIPVAAAIIIALMWPESPSWLACKGDFEKCEQTFIRLRGTDNVSARELSDLIAAQRKIFSKKANKQSLNGLWAKITSRDFYMPALHIFILMNMMYWSGSDVIIIYFLEMASKSTNNENATFYAAIAMYVIIILGMTIADLLILRYDNKKVLLASTFFVTIFLICACIITGLQSLGVISSDSLLFLCCLLFCITSAVLGLDSLVFLISAELMPVKHRSLGGALYVLFNCMLYASSQKISPYLFLHIDLWGTFLLYAINATLSSIFLWKYVPETKNRTLQEIEDYYIYGHFIERKVEESIELLS